MAQEKDVTRLKKLRRLFKHVQSTEASQAVQQLFNWAIAEQKLITQYDLLYTLNIPLTDFRKLEAGLQKYDLTAEERDLINQILSILTSYNNTINICNYKVIASGAPIKKTTMYYITKKGDDAQRDFVIINVNIKGTDDVTLKRLLLEEDDKKNAL